MAAKTYYTFLSDAVTVFPGYITNCGNGTNQCFTVNADNILLEMKITNSLCSSSAKFSLKNPTVTIHPSHFKQAVGGFTTSRIVTGTTLKAFLRKSNIKKFWLESYTSAGVLSQTSVPKVIPEPTGATAYYATLTIGALNVTVPVNGFLVLRHGYTAGAKASNRIYHGANAKAAGQVSLVLLVDEVPAVTADNASNISATLGSFSSSVSYKAGQSDNASNISATLSSFTIASEYTFPPTSDPLYDRATYETNIWIELNRIGLYETAANNRDEIQLNVWYTKNCIMARINDNEMNISLPAYIILQELERVNTNPGGLKKMWKQLERTIRFKSNQGLLT